jgi:3-hydroxyisobutyrate dehydrogenase-like beta-hydroxyacid dehydrogenase
MNIGFLGLGNMGRPLAANLLAAGHHLTVFDLDRAAATDLRAGGAAWAETPREAAAASEVTFTALPGPAEIESVVLGPEGLLEGAHESDVYIDVSTSTPELIRHIASVAGEKGVSVLDAPVSGGVRGARKGTLVFMVGGDRVAFDRCLPLFEVLGSKVLHMGALGTGYIAKLINNFMGMSNAVASMEAMTIGAKAGVDLQNLLDAVNAGTGMSHMSRTLYPFLIFPRRFEPTRFSMSLGAKDLRLAVELAGELGVPLRVGKEVAQALQEAVDRGMGADDFSTYITLLEETAETEVST